VPEESSASRRPEMSFEPRGSTCRGGARMVRAVDEMSRSVLPLPCGLREARVGQPDLPAVAAPNDRREIGCVGRRSSHPERSPETSPRISSGPGEARRADSVSPAQGEGSPLIRAALALLCRTVSSQAALSGRSRSWICFAVLHSALPADRDGAFTQVNAHQPGLSFSPKFHQATMGISIVQNDLRQTRIPVSGYTAINRSASACSASASVTWWNGV
jgi:hypothetical protein